MDGHNYKHLKKRQKLFVHFDYYDHNIDGQERQRLEEKAEAICPP